MKNRILSLEEVTESGGKKVWHQSRYCRFARPVVYQYEHMPHLIFEEEHNGEVVRAESALYGLTWRCWAKKPNQDDLAQKFELLVEKEQGQA